jgi:isopenicillin N synthase-like dioxygenase
MPDTVPTLSFAEVHATDFPSRLGAAFERYGFVIITGHGIPQPLIERFLGVYQRFFALPEAEKRRYHLAGGGGARGYTPFGIETAKGAAHHDPRSSGTSAANCPTAIRSAATCRRTSGSTACRDSAT